MKFAVLVIAALCGVASAQFGPGGLKPCPYTCNSYEDGASSQSFLVCQAPDTTTKGQFVCSNIVPGKFQPGQQSPYTCKYDNAVACLAVRGGGGGGGDAPSPQIADLIAQNKDLSTFWTLVNKAGLAPSFSAPRSETFFIPQNAAFDKLPKQTLEILANNATLLRAVLNLHIVPTRGSPVATADFEDGLNLMTLDRQAVHLSGGGNSWHIVNMDNSSKATIVGTDIKGYTGSAASLMHVIDTVLIPAHVGKPGEECSPVTGPCMDDKGPDGKCRYTPQFSDPSCKPSTIDTFSQGGACCREPCWNWRVNGNGEQCTGTRPTRPAPVTPTLPPNLPTCPLACNASFTKMLSQQFPLTKVIEFAARGSICKNAKTGANYPCDATDLLNGNNKPECSGGQVFQLGPSCHPSCDDPDPTTCAKTDAAYTEDCYCPNSAPVWNDAEGTCMSFKQCPAADQCDRIIEEDYLDAGAAAAKCPNVNVDDYCKTRCLSNKCVPTPQYDHIASVAAYCAKLDEKTCSQGVPSGRPGVCVYAGGGQPPLFSCQLDADGLAAWVPKDPGSCAAGSGSVDETCDFLMDTNCLVEGECNMDKRDPTASGPKCMSVVKQAFQDCAKTCTFTNYKENEQCATCLTKSLLSSNTLNLDQPDIFTCCGCMDDVFKAQGIPNFTTDDLNKLLLEPCASGVPFGPP